MPLLNVYRSDGVYTINDSMPIASYLDTYPGPAVYPRAENGEICPLKKAVIDTLILNCNEPITIIMRKMVFGRSLKDEDVK